MPYQRARKRLISIQEVREAAEHGFRFAPKREFTTDFNLASELARGRLLDLYGKRLAQRIPLDEREQESLMHSENLLTWVGIARKGPLKSMPPDVAFHLLAHLETSLEQMWDEAVERRDNAQARRSMRWIRNVREQASRVGREPVDFPQDVLDTTEQLALNRMRGVLKNRFNKYWSDRRWISNAVKRQLRELMQLELDFGSVEEKH
jgi:hypothetical protein